MFWALGLIALLALGAVVLFHAAFVAPFDLRVSEVEAPVAGLPAALDGYTIAVLADLHHRPGMPAWHLRRAVRAVNAAAPDAVALLGDYGVSLHYEPHVSRWLYRRVLPVITPVMRELRARDGVFAVLGNHEYYAGAEIATAWLAAIGARALINECAVVRRGEATLRVVGIDDVTHRALTAYPDCPDAERRGPDGAPAAAPTVVLAHNPDVVLHLPSAARVDLVLAGHTHGGQIVIPFLGAPLRLAKVCGWKTASGWVPNPRAPLYVSRGIGCQVPVRFCCPPEVVVVRLRPRGQGPGAGYEPRGQGQGRCALPWPWPRRPTPGLVPGP